MDHPELTPNNFSDLVEAARRKAKNTTDRPDDRPNYWLEEHSWFPQLKMRGADFGKFVAFGLLFVIVSAYAGALLNTRRSVSYLKVPRDSGSTVNPEFHEHWDELYKNSSPNAPESALWLLKI
ncbi:hypothetical protein BDD12DRAFT_894761 [Trichophaea hybrida]|nr:hypothetical protein BDD12DRAFT_894761 [Trichophaea hybrida]